MGAKMLVAYQSGAEGGKNPFVFWVTTSKSPKQNKQMKRNTIDCKETCWAVSCRCLTLAHHRYLDTCTVYTLGTVSAHALAVRWQGSQAGSPGAWPGVSRGFPGPCGAQMHRAASRCPAHQQRARTAPDSPALHRTAVTAGTQHPCHQKRSARRDLWLCAV